MVYGDDELKAFSSAWTYHVLTDLAIRFADNPKIVNFASKLEHKHGTERRKRSSGGVWRSNGRLVPGVIIGLSIYKNKSRFDHFEYARINHDPEIGALGWVDTYTSIATDVVHEIAHALQFWTTEPGTPHGKWWQKIYRWLRRHYVNDRAKWTAADWRGLVGLENA